MRFDVMHGADSLAGNALLGGDRKAAYRQTQREHDDLLDIRTLPDYEKVLMMPPGPAKSIAIAMLNAEADIRESEYPKYWNDATPRRNITQSSSWMGGFDYDPYSQVLTVDMNGRGYTFPGFTPEHVAEWLNSDSLGKYFNRNLKGKWA